MCASASTLVAVVSSFLAGAQGLGSFYLPDAVVGGFNLGNHSYAFSAGHATNSSHAGAIGLYFDESITFRIPDDPDKIIDTTVLELTYGGGWGAAQMDADFKLTVSDGAPVKNILHIYYHKSNNEILDGSGTALIPLNGANATMFTIDVERWDSSIGDDAKAPAAYIGVVAATWQVGEIHSGEQVIIVDLDTHGFTKDGSCVRTNTSRLGTLTRGADYFHDSPDDTCFINLNFSDSISRLQEPIFMHMNGHRKNNEYNKATVYDSRNSSVPVKVIEMRQDYDGAETSFFSLQIPSEYLQSHVSSMTSASDHSLTSLSSNLPYTSVFAKFRGWLNRYAKLQGTGTAAKVLDLSQGAYQVSGLYSSKSGVAPNIDNSALTMASRFIPWFSKPGSFSFPAPISDPPYFLEIVHSRLDSDAHLNFLITDNVTGYTIVNGSLQEYEDDISSTNRNFFYIAGLTSGVLNIACDFTSNEGIYFSPFFTARLLQGRTPVPTPSPTPVPTPSPTPVPTPSPTPVPTPSPTPVPTPVPTPEPTPVPTPSAPTPLPTPSAPTPLPTPSAPTPLPTPSAPTPLPTPSSIPAPTPAPSPTPVPTPVPPQDVNLASLLSFRLESAMVFVAVMVFNL